MNKDWQTLELCDRFFDAIEQKDYDTLESCYAPEAVVWHSHDSLYQPRATAPLDEIAQLIGFPGKLGMDGSKVWDAFQRGEIAAIRNYCETDAANTYLVYLRFQLLRGMLTAEQYELEIAFAYDTLARSTASHWQEFIGAWQRDSAPDARAAAG